MGLYSNLKAAFEADETFNYFDMDEFDAEYPGVQVFVSAPVNDDGRYRHLLGVAVVCAHARSPEPYLHMEEYVDAAFRVINTVPETFPYLFPHNVIDNWRPSPESQNTYTTVILQVAGP